jgi:hypothetical protein
MVEAMSSEKISALVHIFHSPLGAPAGRRG